MDGFRPPSLAHLAYAFEDIVDSQHEHANEDGNHRKKPQHPSPSANNKSDKGDKREEKEKRKEAPQKGKVKDNH